MIIVRINYSYFLIRLSFIFKLFHAANSHSFSLIHKVYIDIKKRTSHDLFILFFFSYEERGKLLWSGQISPIKKGIRASLVAQWLRVCLLMQGTRVRALVWEDLTCRVSNWAREPQLLSLRVWSLCSATREATMVRGLRTAMKSGPRSPQLEKALAQKRRPNTAKNK